MPAERIAMRLVREILRLITVEKLSVREIARQDRQGAVDGTGDARAMPRRGRELAASRGAQRWRA